MKICPKCGSELFEDSAFCTKCGAQLNIPEQANAVSRGMKKALTSPVALIAMIVYTIKVLLNIVSVCSGSGRASNEDWLSYFVHDDTISVLSGVIVFGWIVCIIPMVLTVIGLWMIYASSVRRDDLYFSTSGMTVVKAAIIVDIALSSFMLFVSELALFSFFEMAGSVFDNTDGSVSPGSARLMIVVMMAGLMIFFAVLILYFAKALKTIKTMKIAAAGGAVSDNIPSFVAEFAIILGAARVIFMLLGGDALTLITGLCSTVALIAFGMFLLSCRKKMCLLTESREGHSDIQNI